MEVFTAGGDFVKVERSTVTVFDGQARVIMSFAINSPFGLMLQEAMEKASAAHRAGAEAARRGWRTRRWRA